MRDPILAQMLDSDYGSSGSDIVRLMKLAAKRPRLDTIDIAAKTP